MQKLKGTLKTPSREDLNSLSDLLRSFTTFPLRAPPFASAPIRSSPSRTSDPTRPSPDPEGAYIPTYFASVHFQDKSGWLQLKDKLEHFGHQSGLFDEIAVKQLGEMEGGPFQLQIRKVGKHKAGPKRNLIDVGYGVSQALPVLAELFRPDASPMLLFQQPEVHLHPSAQAALGSLFCETAVSGRQLIIETHSDYIIDRVLLDIRDKRTDLKRVRLFFVDRRPEGLLPAARQELLDPSKAWWGGRRGRLADRPRYSISVSLGVVPLVLPRRGSPSTHRGRGWLRSTRSFRTASAPTQLATRRIQTRAWMKQRYWVAPACTSELHHGRGPGTARPFDDAGGDGNTGTACRRTRPPG